MGSELCPVCGADDCDVHLLGSFDLSGDGGEYDIGLMGGALYDADAIGEVLSITRLAWVKSKRSSKKPKPPEWIAKTQLWDLKNYFEELGSAGGFSLEEYKTDEEAAGDLASYTNQHVTIARWVLENVLNECGWAGAALQRTKREYGGPGQASIYESWWDPEPKKVVARLKQKLQEITAMARPWMEAQHMPSDKQPLDTAQNSPPGPDAPNLSAPSKTAPTPSSAQTQGQSLIELSKALGFKVLPNTGKGYIIPTGPRLK